MPVYRLYYWSPKRRCLLPHEIDADSNPDDDALLERFARAGRSALRLCGVSRPADTAIPEAPRSAAPPPITQARNHIREAMRLLDQINGHVTAATPARHAGRLHLHYRD